MSLFGNLGSGNQGGGSSSGPSFRPLFGNATTGASTGGLFGNLGLGGNTCSSAPSGTSQPTTSGGLGGGLGGGFSGFPGASTTASTSGPTSTAPPAFGNPFGTSTSQAQPQSTAANQPGQQTGAFGASFLGSTTGTQQQQQQQAAGQSTNGVAGGASSHFDHLIERGKKRNAGENGITNFEELPSLQLGLGDIARKVRNLGQGGPSAQDQAQERAAHCLLSASGVKLGSTLRDLNQFSTQSGVAAGTGANPLDTDVDSYISNLHSQSTLALIQEGLEQSKRDFDSFLEENMQIEWDAQRKRIYEHFGLGRQAEDFSASQQTAGGFGASSARGAFGRSTRNKRTMGPKASTNGSSFQASGAPPVLGSVMSPHQRSTRNGESQDKPVIGSQLGPEDRFVRDKQEKFMDKVKELNISRLQKEPYAIFHAFEDVEEHSGSDNAEHMVSTYKALVTLTGELPDPRAAVGSNMPKERCFKDAYLDYLPSSPNSIGLRKRILRGSLKHLETQFKQTVSKEISKNPREAQTGGVPTDIHKIRGYIRVRIAHKELTTDIEQLQKIGTEGDEYPWVIIFFLLRSGLLQEAAEYVRERRNFFQNNDRNFAAAIAQYSLDPERRLGPDMQQKINHVYAQRARIAPTNDPYRMACYKVIGRCEMTRRSLDALPPSMEDWLWLQFNLAREGNPAEENAGETFGLQELRASIEEVGKRHFASGGEGSGGYGVYFYLATLAGMYEEAINYLYEYNYVSAVHFAIALDYYGLLRVSDWNTAGTQIISRTSGDKPQLNFGRIIGTYTSDFRSARADAAAEYLILICLNADLPGEAGKAQASLCHEALRELVLETREFTTLLGDIKNNGHKIVGLLEERNPLMKLSDEKELITKITREAASSADDNGRTNDAVLLCHLAQEYDIVVTIMSRALAEALSVDLGQEPLRLEPLRPRVQAQAQGNNQAPLPAGPHTSASQSLLGTDDPMELANSIMHMYNNDRDVSGKIDSRNRDTLVVLYKLNVAKKLIEERKYMEGLDLITDLGILPLMANGSLTVIRQSAATFSTFPTELTRNIGNILLWSIMCCSRHRETLLEPGYEVGRKRLADELLQKAKDLMVFAGLIRYKLPPRVFECLAREGGEGGL